MLRSAAMGPTLCAGLFLYVVVEDGSGVAVYEDPIIPFEGMAGPTSRRDA